MVFHFTCDSGQHFQFWVKSFSYSYHQIRHYFLFQEYAETNCAEDLYEDTAVYDYVKEYEMIEAMPASEGAIMKDSTDKGTYVNVSDEQSYQELGPVPDTKPDIYTDLQKDL